MITLRKANDRGHADYGWLNTYHTFSFGPYRDPNQMGFRALRVMNEDRVVPGEGFGTHAHYNMEIVSYVLSGALEHKDSMGNGEVLQPGEFQRITAGSGITHSEFNPSDSQPTHFYQIWLLPETKDLDPSYQQQRFDEAELTGALRLVASPGGDEGSLTIHQDARIYLSKLPESESVEHQIPASRHAWLQVLRGSVELNGENLETSDGAAISEEDQLTISATTPAELMLFDLA